MDRYTWSDVAEEKLNALVTRRMVHTRNTTLARIVLLKGAVVPMHEHVNEQITTVETGVVEFQMGGETFEVRAGESLVIPPGMPHSVQALEDAVAFDIFSPPREDWIRGDDAYLRK